MNTDQLFRKHYRQLCLYALHYLQDVETVKDVVQDCFVRLLECDEEPHNQRAWLYTAVRNRCIDLLRRSKPIDVVVPEDLDGPITDDEAQQRSEREALLWAAIDELPERCREVFLLAKRDGMTYREIADNLNISEKTVENQIGKALKRLRSKAHIYSAHISAQRSPSTAAETMPPA